MYILFACSVCCSIIFLLLSFKLDHGNVQGKEVTVLLFETEIQLRIVNQNRDAIDYCAKDSAKEF